MSTAERLASTLAREGLPELAVLARQYFYDDYHSPLDHPLQRLAHDLREAGRDDLAQRAEEWAPTREDAVAVLDSPRGRELLELYRPGTSGCLVRATSSGTVLMAPGAHIQ